MKRSILFAAMFCSLCLSGVALGVTIYVPADYLTIQAGIDAASDGYSVIVADGTYTGAGNVNLDFNGKGIYVHSASFDPAKCIIDCGNASETRGFNFHSSESPGAALSGFTIRNGNAGSGPDSYGGGIRCVYSSPTITDCIISGNSANSGGGGIECWSSSPTITNCVIYGNSADFGGGIRCKSSSSPTITNCLITGNATTWYGGGIYCNSSSPTIRNCTISGNEATNGGGIESTTSSSPTITNCILWGNSAILNSEINVSSGSLIADYCDIEGGCPTGVTCTNCIYQDPQFVAGSRGDFYLNHVAKSVSPCINAGDDLASNIYFPGPGHTDCMDELTTRVDGVADSGIVDIGFHYRLHSVRHVPADYTTIQAGIDAAADGDIVMVADETYTGAGNVNLDFNGKAITVRSASDNPATCIIDCQNASEVRGFHFHNSETSSSVVRGFTIKNGNMNGSYPNYYGGGIFCRDSSSPTIIKCTITGNAATNYGGGVCCESSSSPMIANCTITGNSAGMHGGGICSKSSSSPTITNCVISENAATDGGGGIECWSSSPTITNCAIYGNAADFGGGIRCKSSSSPTITNCLITGNATTWYGGGIYCNSSSPTITNCTISGNEATNGGGIECTTSSSPTLTNCILWGNSAVLNSEINVSSGSPIADYCDIEGGCPTGVTCTNCMDQDPQFVVGSLGAFYLDCAAKAVSPCIDTGSDLAWNICFTGLDGTVCLDELTTRIDDIADLGTVDMGFHYRPTFALRVPADYPTIQAGIDAAKNGDVVMVADETYTGAGNVNLDFNGKAITVRSENDDPSTCIINCQNTGETRGFYFHNSETEAAVVRGFTIKNGNSGYRGGGIYCNESSPSIRDCVFEGNSASTNGGGLAFNNSSSTIVNCTFRWNSSTYGGGLYCTSNSAIAIINCLIHDNSAGTRGGGMYCSNSPAAIINCTFAYNVASTNGGGVCFGNSTATVRNCIVRSNTPNGLYAFGANSPSVTYSDTQATHAGAGNIRLDPQFVIGRDGAWYLDYSAKAVSPCIDAGDAAASGVCFPDGRCLSSFTTRVDGAVDSGTVDMGFHFPYFYTTPTPTFTPTLTPTPIPTDTPTFTPTPTFTFTPTPIPTDTPIPTFTPTPTFTFTPTFTPTPIPTDTPTPTPTPMSSHNGDVNGDGSVDPGDAYLALEIYLGMEPPGADWIAADFCPRPNGDGSVDPGDAFGILKAYLGYPDPCSW